MIREETRVHLAKAFSKVAYFNSRAMDADVFEQEMWLELCLWVKKHGEEGTITGGKHAGKVLLEQTPVFIAYRMAGRASKNLWHVNRQRRGEVSIEDLNLGTGASSQGKFEGSIQQDEAFDPATKHLPARQESVRTLILWAYRERGLLTPEVEKAVVKMYREKEAPDVAPIQAGPINYHIDLGDTHEMALSKRLASLTGAEALDVLIFLEEKTGRYYEAVRAVLEYGGASKAELMGAGISCKLFAKAKKELSQLYD
jgi:hypothetical protein